MKLKKYITKIAEWVLPQVLHLIFHRGIPEELTEIILMLVALLPLQLNSHGAEMLLK